jgi:hypothetical protein
MSSELTNMYNLQSRESRHVFGIGIQGLKLSEHRDFGTNILFISYTKCIANLVLSLYFFFYFSTPAQLEEFEKEIQLMIDVKIR